jgi:type I restriction enzyme R subunit
MRIILQPIPRKAGTHSGGRRSYSRLDDGKKRYINEVTALSQAFAIAIPHEQALDVKDEVAFFQAVKARLAKFDSSGGGKTDEAIETTIRQVIDRAGLGTGD